MKITLYSLSKKPNSTKRPTGTGKSFNCVLKAPTSILNPTIDLTGLTVKPTEYNYAYIPDFDRYYYIDNWTSGPRNLWTCDLSVDALASFKSDIGKQTLYVTRCSSTSDGTITDTMYPTKNVWSEIKSEYDSPFDVALNSCYWCIGIKGSGKTTFYIFKPGGVDAFFSYILSDTYAADVLGALGLSADSEAAAIIDPLQYVSSVTCIPVNVGLGFTNPETIQIGYVTHTFTNCQKIDFKSALIGTYNYTCPGHPDATRGTYLNNAPYAQYYAYVPGFGKIDLDPSIVASKTITMSLHMDYRNGDCLLTVSAGDAGIVTRLTTCIGIPFEFSQVIAAGTSALSVVGTAANVVSSIMGGNYANAIGGAIGSIKSAIENSIPSANSIGSNGSFAAIYGTKIQFIARYARPVAEDNSHRGRPLCQLKKISTIPGYIMISDSDIDIACYPSEREEIMAALTGGFFYE